MTPATPGISPIVTRALATVATAMAAASMVLVAPAPAASASATSDLTVHRSNRFLLALGDSISFGFQGPKVTDPPNPAVFNTGYVDVLAGRDRSLAEVTNLSCPGETTITFISGGCPWRESGFALHDRYSGSQLDAAVAFLRTHRKDTGLITLAIWGNDIQALASECGGDITCVSQRAPTAIAAFTGRLGKILRALRAAAPTADIAVLATFHAVPPPTPEIDALHDALNKAISRTARSIRAEIADARAVFNPSDDAARAAAICEYTLQCATSGADSHPSDAGYVAIADAFTTATDCSWPGKPRRQR